MPEALVSIFSTLKKITIIKMGFSIKLYTYLSIEQKRARK
jgi:hypothetical protein